MILGVIPRIGAKCGMTNLLGLEGNIYPPCFFIALAVFVLFWLYNFYMIIRGHHVSELLI